MPFHTELIQIVVLENKSLGGPEPLVPHLQKYTQTRIYSNETFINGELDLLFESGQNHGNSANLLKYVVRKEHQVIEHIQ